MAAASYFNNTVQALGIGNMNLNSDTIKVMLTNTAPVATNSNYSDVSSTELANGNGYTTGGATVGSTSYTLSTATSTLVGNAVTFTASGSMGPFRYAIAYDSTPTNKTLLLSWDYGSSITLNASETFTITWAGNTPTNAILQITHA